MNRENDSDGVELARLRTELARLRQVEDRLRAENEHLLESQQELEDTRSHYVELYDVAPIPWITLNADGTVRDVNLLAATLFGSSRGYLSGIPLKVLIHPDDRRALLQHLAECRRQDELARCELRVLSRGEEPAPMLLLSRRPYGPEGIYVIALIDQRDRAVAEKEREQLALREREAIAANEAKDQFIAVLSHELRTPLTPVLAAVSALAEQPSFSQELCAIFAMVQRNVVAEVRLIDDLLDVTRITHGKMQIEKHPVDLHVIVREGLDTLRTELEGKHLSLLVAPAATQHWVNGDAIRLRQVFLNIVRNAIKFTPDAGRIEIRSWNRDDRVIVEVADTGCGIRPTALERVFSAFEQAAAEDGTHAGGLGLGLAICRGIVELHGGRIVATSPGEGQGSRFLVELGAIEEPELSLESERPRSRPPPNSRPRILLIEDHQDTVELFNELLNGVGYEVRTANSCRTALEAELMPGDIVVSDLGLSDGSGLDLIKLLKIKAPVRAIALSGFGTEADKLASLEAGFSVHLTKPVQFETLLAAIGDLGN
ncbi:MAG TPA: ATP-binding protein [Polyangiaceae bacterium]|nr:ATP-binding protein [Polyangiaceae bacterium]